MWRQFWECGDECGFGRHKQRQRHVWIKQCIQWWVRRRWWRFDIFGDFTSKYDIMCATQGCMVMKETLAVTECWQKEIKNQEKQTKAHSKKTKTSKIPSKKIQNNVFPVCLDLSEMRLGLRIWRQSRRKKQNNVFPVFSRFGRSAPCTQNLSEFDDSLAKKKNNVFSSDKSRTTEMRLGLRIWRLAPFLLDFFSDNFIFYVFANIFWAFCVITVWLNIRFQFSDNLN